MKALSIGNSDVNCSSTVGQRPDDIGWEWGQGIKQDRDEFEALNMSERKKVRKGS